MTFYERLLPRSDYKALERKRTARYYRVQDEDEDTIEEGDRAPVINTNNEMVTNATRQTSEHKHNTSQRPNNTNPKNCYRSTNRSSESNDDGSLFSESE